MKSIASTALTLFMSACDSLNDVAVISRNESVGEESDATLPADIIAIDENFDQWEDGSKLFDLTNGEADGFLDNNTRQQIAGHDCLAIHALAEVNYDNGYSVELQLPLNGKVDMSSGDFVISFDIYMPSATHEKAVHLQFGFLNSDKLKAIYSKWYSNTVFTADQWSRISAPINDSDGFIDHDEMGGMENWFFDKVRIQTALDEAECDGEEILLYVDNIHVDNF